MFGMILQRINEKVKYLILSPGVRKKKSWRACFEGYVGICLLALVIWGLSLLVNCQNIPATKIWKKSYGMDFVHLSPGSGDTVDPSFVWKDCLKAEFSSFAKKCRARGGFFKCCLGGWDFYQKFNIQINFFLLEKGWINMMIFVIPWGTWIWPEKRPTQGDAERNGRMTGGAGSHTLPTSVPLRLADKTGCWLNWTSIL